MADVAPSSVGIPARRGVPRASWKRRIQASSRICSSSSLATKARPSGLWESPLTCPTWPFQTASHLHSRNLLPLAMPWLLRLAIRNSRQMLACPLPHHCHHRPRSRCSPPQLAHQTPLTRHRTEIPLPLFRLRHSLRDSSSLLMLISASCHLFPNVQIPP